MKKILSILMVIACLGIAIPAQAQLKFGLKGGLNITSLSFSGDMFKGDNRTGFFRSNGGIYDSGSGIGT